MKVTIKKNGAIEVKYCCKRAHRLCVEHDSTYTEIENGERYTMSCRGVTYAAELINFCPFCGEKIKIEVER